MTDLSELEALVGRATPGPWHVYGNDGDWPGIEAFATSIVVYGEPGEEYSGVRGKEGPSEIAEAKANAALIVAAVNAIPHLISTIRSQEAALVELRAENEELKSEEELFDASHADQNRMVDRISDLIGLPHDSELDTTAFELWFSGQDATITALRAALVEAREAADAYRDALTPSGDTKATYIGEIKDQVIRLDEDGEETWGDHTISWDATKATMAMIEARAASALSKLEGGE